MPTNPEDWIPLLRTCNLPPYPQLRSLYRKQKGYLSDTLFKNLGKFLYNAVATQDVLVRWDMADQTPVQERLMWKMFFNSTPDEQERAVRFLHVFKVLTALTRPAQGVSLRAIQSAADVARVNVVVTSRGSTPNCKATYAGGTTVLITWPCR